MTHAFRPPVDYPKIVHAARAYPPYPKGTPVLYEDDEDPEMGESNVHTILDHILFMGLTSHFHSRTEYQVFSNLNLHYSVEGHEDESYLPYVSPDIMIVRPYECVPIEVDSYRIHREGTAPDLALEILSPRTAFTLDPSVKVELYRTMGVREYILVDRSGELLPQRSMLKRLFGDGTRKDCRDADGGVTSRIGFRLLFDETNRISVIDVQSGYRYRRYDEVEAEFKARRQAEADVHAATEARRQAEADARNRTEQRIRELEEEVKRLRGE